MILRAVLCWLICSIVLGAKLLATPPDTVSFEQLPRLQAQEKRLVFVLIGTDWCQYCHTMQQALQDQMLAPLLEKSYYLLMLNADEQRPIRFDNQIYRYQPNGVQTGTHALASCLGGDEKGRLSLPSFCILNEKNELLIRYSGFMRKKDLLKLLKAYQDEIE